MPKTILKRRVTRNDMDGCIALIYEALNHLEFDDESSDEINTAMAWVAEECGVEVGAEFFESRGL